MGEIEIWSGVFVWIRCTNPLWQVAADVRQLGAGQVRLPTTVRPSDRYREAHSTANAAAGQDDSSGAGLHRAEHGSAVHRAADVRPCRLVRRLALLCTAHLRPVARSRSDGRSAQVRRGPSVHRLNNSDHFSWPGTGELTIPCCNVVKWQTENSLMLTL